LKEIINFNSKFTSLEVVNPLITKYRINICQADIPANKYIFSKSIIDGMSTTICGAGVYAYYFDKYDQLGGHSDDVIKTPYGYVKTPETKAYGFSDPYKMPYWMEIDGENWFCADIYIWTGINPEIEDILNNSVVWQSMQVAVDEEQDSQGNKIVNDAVFLGFCLLQGIDPAYSGSTITKFSLDEISSKINMLSSEISFLKQEYEQFTKQSDLQVESESKNNLDNDKLDTLNIDSTKEFSNNNNQEKEVNEEVIKEAMEKFSLNSNQIREILNNALSGYKYLNGINEWNKYWVNCYDETYVYVDDEEDYKTYRMTYDIADNVGTVNIESAEEVIRGGFIPIGQEQEAVQMSEEVVEESKEENCSEEVTESSNEFVDNPAMEALNEKSAEDNKELADENLENPEEVNASESEVVNESENKDAVIISLKTEMSDLQEKFTKMETDMNVYMAENTQLKEFKASIDKQNKEFSVETTLKEVQNILPTEEMEACRLSAETFSLENIDIWKNEVKAKAFNFSKGIPEKKPFIQIAFPTSDKPKSGNGLWD